MVGMDPDYSLAELKAWQNMQLCGNGGEGGNIASEPPPSVPDDLEAWQLIHPPRVTIRQILKDLTL